MPDCLFVYGTLRSEFDNRHARLLRRNATLVEKTTVLGSIYRVRHYPAYRPQPVGEVRGELYRLHDPAATLRALDEYEGEEFERVAISETKIPSRDRKGATTWIYQYRMQPPESSRIVSGDFCAT